MKKIRILLTGSNGFLGQKLTEHVVLEKKYALACTSASSNRNHQKDGYEFRQINFADTEQLFDFVKQYAPTHIIHTAAISNVERCASDTEACDLVNVTIPQLLAEYSVENQVHLTFLSTDFVFDGNSAPYSESDDYSPVNAYGESKVKAEQAIMRSGCSYAILRTILVYGVHGDPNRNNMITWVRKALSGGQQINVVKDQWRTPTWVDDLCKACLTAVERDAEGIFHVSGDELMSVFEMAEQIADFWGLDKLLLSPIPASTIGHDKNRPVKTSFILNKARTELGYQPTPFADALAEIDTQYKKYR